jgi:hypothetical protein
VDWLEIVDGADFIDVGGVDWLDFGAELGGELVDVGSWEDWGPGTDVYLNVGDDWTGDDLMAGAFGDEDWFMDDLIFPDENPAILSDVLRDYDIGVSPETVVRTTSDVLRSGGSSPAAPDRFSGIADVFRGLGSVVTSGIDLVGGVYNRARTVFGNGQQSTTPRPGTLVIGGMEVSPVLAVAAVGAVVLLASKR